MTLPQHDPAWLERMYNNRALVPDHADYFDRWASESAAARANQPCKLDIAYGPGPGETLDVFAPARSTAGGAPVLVFIHGGYWRSLDKSDHSFIAPAFTQPGFCVVVVNYALCPGTTEAPVTVAHIGRQMEKALGWVWRNAESHGGDPRRITVAGHSAGGQLAAMLLTSVWPLIETGLPDGLVRNALSISGVHDLEPLMHTPFLQQALHLTEQQVLQCSPARLLEPPAGRLFCAVGGDESPEFQRQNQLMQDAWGSHYVPRSVVLAGLNHFSILDALVRPGHDLHHMALNLLRS
ncbi:MAG: alpha/beta hydrolase [Acidovorax sp.]|jgi:arylformamidase|uniref:alpha/beta hydrolase n=1 Tax=Acidovorax sp. TaxID=1872122 RepID=UPI000A8FED3D|nr:alpha/beta hydrolase [Acidovorax sp.]MDH4425907.1 alpha/beta hydrolase [Acidovorax sp.]